MGEAFEWRCRTSCAETTKQGVDKRRVPHSQPRTQHALSPIRTRPLARIAMSQSLQILVDRSSKAARSAHNNFRALYLAVGSDSIAPSLAGVGVDLDKLSITLDLLSKSTPALSSELAHDVFESRMSADVKLSRAIVHDLNTIAGRLRSMTPSRSSEPAEIMHEHECQDISEMIKRYDRAVSAALRDHDS
jgi:hypothetical protein